MPKSRLPLLDYARGRLASPLGGELLAMTKAAFSCHCEAYVIGRGNLKRPVKVLGNRPLRRNDRVDFSGSVWQMRGILVV